MRSILTEFSPRRGRLVLILGLAVATLPGMAWGHSFGVVYNLPVPFWLYAWTSAAALLVSFGVAAYFFRNPQPLGQRFWTLTLSGSTASVGLTLRRWVQLASLAVLLLAVLTGYLGSQDPYQNPAMTLFWVWWLLGAVYASAVVGSLIQMLNPWWALSGLAARLPGFRNGQGRFTPSERLGRWPAVISLAALLWLELFGGTRPQHLAIALSGYSLVTLIGVWLFGRGYWSRNGELFGVLFDLFGRMAPLEVWSGARGRPEKIRVSWPFSRLAERSLDRPGEIAFVLLLLAATAFDGLHETVVWLQIYWVQLPQWLALPVDGNPFRSFQLLRPWFECWQVAWLYLSAVIYVLAYGLIIRWMAAAVSSPFSRRELAQAFAGTLLPIALVYHAAHYFTLLLTQGPKISPLLSDPFGWGWDLLGTRDQIHYQNLPDAGWVWHLQVALILGGHIISVIAAHQVAIGRFRTPGRAFISQIPMLLMMMGLTVFGLWILSQPLQAAKPG